MQVRSENPKAMTPAARLSAAITVLDHILQGAGAEGALTAWGRASRFAGSGDRNAVRDLVFDALRRRRSAAALGGGLSGRGLILGLLRQRNADVASLFTGEGHAPDRVSPEETGHLPQGLEALDCPDWLGPALKGSLGDDFDAVLCALQDRAPVFLRVNTARISRDQARAALAAEGVATIPSPKVKTCLQVTDNARKVQKSRAYLSGLVELQDLSSQAVVQALPVAKGASVLDYCAGGGGKSLALAARGAARVHAWDIAATRMKDLPLRAARAGAAITILRDPGLAAPYDLVLCDAPCSGSGSWRRDPQGKWALSQDSLTQVVKMQAQVLDKASVLVGMGGVLAYATCSMLRVENEDQVAGFLARHAGWTCQQTHRFSPLDGGDGFFLALLGNRDQD